MGGRQADGAADVTLLPVPYIGLAVRRALRDCGMVPVAERQVLEYLEGQPDTKNTRALRRAVRHGAMTRVEVGR